MNIGIYSPNWVGDAVLSFPFVNRCRRHFPDAHITIVAKSWVVAVFQRHPKANEIITIDQGQLKGILPTTRSGRSLQSAQFDRFYLLSDSLRSAYLAWLSGCDQRIGVSGRCVKQVDETVPYKHPDMAYERCLTY